MRNMFNMHSNGVRPLSIYKLKQLKCLRFQQTLKELMSHSLRVLHSFFSPIPFVTPAFTAM